MNGIIYLEDGTVYMGSGFGALGTAVGELVFNTSMIGYQEVLEDPSNAGNVVNMTYPWIGNYGIRESKLNGPINTKGIIVKVINHEPSNYKSIKNLDQYMKENGVVGVSGVDTRAITKKIRKSGSVKCVITNEELSVSDLEKIIKEVNMKTNYIEAYSVKAIEKTNGERLNIGVLDLGDKDKIVESLKTSGCGMTIFPHDASLETIESQNVDGMIISDGPGNIEQYPELIEKAKKITEKYPTFGVSLGHQLLAAAFGAQVKKMKYGHRGGNHAVYDYAKKRAYIVPQNHGYVVERENLESTPLEITHENLNDNTVEGLKHKDLKMISIQFNLELESDLENTSYLLKDFVDSLKEGK